MKSIKFLAPLYGLVMALVSCNGQAPAKNNEPLSLPEVFYDRNFCVVAGNWNESGCALILDHKGKPEIQNVSSHNEFYDIDFELLPLYAKEEEGKTTYFLPFFVKGQVIDDGYFKDGKQYRFYLRFDNPTYYCAVSLNDPSISTPDKVLTEGMM